MNSRRLLGTILVFATLVFAAPKPEPAPHFNAKTISGETFNNASIKGKVVLLQFWATWCPYCRGEQQIVDDLQKEFADKGLIVLAVDVGESKKKVRRRNPSTLLRTGLTASG